MRLHEGQPVVTLGAPLGSGRGAVIMVHGRNATPANIVELVPVLNQPEFTYLAPAAANGTWYPYSFLTDIERNEPFLSSALNMLGQLVATLEERGVAKSRIVLLGFSQGACLASECAVRHASRYGGLIAFSGGLIGPPGTTWDCPGTFDGMPVFLGCSDVDSHVPASRVDETASVFSRMGAAVTKRIYPGMGHLINEDEIASARELLDLVGA